MWNSTHSSSLVKKAGPLKSCFSRSDYEGNRFKKQRSRQGPGSVAADLSIKVPDDEKSDDFG
jgi:hypothetical protein